MSSGDVPRTPGGQGPTAATSPEPVRVLLVEDDDADALLVDEQLRDAGVTVELRRARSLAEALGSLGRSDVECVLLDLGLPDSFGLAAVEQLRQVAERAPVPPALVVLTGHTGVDQGVQAVAAGADDYLVKGEIESDLLGRSLRYALQRRRSVAQQRALYRSEVRAAETARLERALLPKPLVQDGKVSVMVGYLPGGNGLLGGDFFDTVERPDGTVLSVIGDVAGHGPDEAALGATLRTAWRTLVLTDTPAERVLPLLERVLLTERSRPEIFVTLCQVAVSPGRDHAQVALAGHPAPMLLTGPVGDVRCEVLPDDARGRALGIPVEGGWDAHRVELDGPFALMLYTDGLVEAEVDPEGLAVELPRRRGVPRLGVEGLHALVSEELAREGIEGVVERVLRRVRRLHGGPLTDDAALLVVGWTGRDTKILGTRSSTLADSDEWART
ncbi:PP2C family protein-serine/threonine phosphatase [Isoptericola variabilis]|uniref:Response regulator receiver modulated serine phosphatase n=1 Tax=Isoptericola variabilis (strain 225) TaxID=743718 RepID=F6FSH1_ISOV2|nr:response regulator [Isoptericola variabilis]AEG44038.1 response regulator receiver modulated serine phosphatase [Isoptericola variabilis 225]TWH31773.1 Serine phosphatase RsbU, regulator of sigma subunit [Isoptericola variabilis J7]